VSNTCKYWRNPRYMVFTNNSHIRRWYFVDGRDGWFLQLSRSDNLPLYVLIPWFLFYLNKEITKYIDISFSSSSSFSSVCVFLIEYVTDCKRRKIEINNINILVE
jgi:hypothetical protein